MDFIKDLLAGDMVALQALWLLILPIVAVFALIQKVRGK